MSEPNGGPRVQCRKCGDVIQSKHRHDFVRCKCGEIFVDGGSEYLRYGAGDLNDVIVLDEETK
jgi:hypothetical protein